MSGVGYQIPGTHKGTKLEQVKSVLLITDSC